MKQGSSKLMTFNLIEVIIALFVIMVALVAVGTLLPQSMNSSKNTVNRICASDSGDQFLNHLVTQLHENWEMRKCIPIGEEAVNEEPDTVFSNNRVLATQNLDISFQADNVIDDWDPAVHNSGVFLVRQKTHTVGVSFQGIARVWRENIDDTGDDNPGGIKLFAEISWPPELPHAEREKAEFTTVVANTGKTYAMATSPSNTGLSSIIGKINLNPKNNSDFEFRMVTPSGEITRDTLHEADNSYTYDGSATYIWLRPKGNGNQNSLIVDDEPYNLHNGDYYEISGDDLQVHLYNSNSNGNAMGKWYIEISLSEGTVSQNGSGSEEEEEADDLFSIEGGEVVVNTDVETTFALLGCAIQAGSSDCYVTCKMKVGNQQNTPFGPYNNPRQGNVNDGETHSFSAGVVEAGKSVSVAGTSWLPNRQRYLEVNSSPANQNVLVLKNGDSVPDISGFNGQSGLEAFIQNYIDTGSRTVTIEDNQAIFLFELGTTNMSSAAADFQDMVMLITFTPE